ncbi:hypothetical protein [Photobacterium leiognathi]|uniref:hypothetical protein n=1 Tax=Photobacterium leiognathi TaxID=553611 RepID=UPI0034E96369
MYDIVVPEKKKNIFDYIKQYLSFSKQFKEVFLKENKVDIVHCNFADPAIYARGIAKKMNVPIVISTQHELCMDLWV